MRTHNATCDNRDDARHFKSAARNLDHVGDEVASVAENEDQESLNNGWDSEESHVLEQEGQRNAKDEAHWDGDDSKEQELDHDY